MSSNILEHRLLKGSKPYNEKEDAKQREEKEKHDNYWRPDYHVETKEKWVRTEANKKVSDESLSELRELLGIKKKNPVPVDEKDTG